MKESLIIKVLTAALVFFIAGIALLYGDVSVKSNSVDILKRGELTKFSGSVKIRAGNILMESDEALSDKGSALLTAAGSVKVTYSSGTLKVISYSTAAVLDSKRKIITMTGNVKNIIDHGEGLEESPPTVIYSDTVKINYADREKLEAEFTGSVKVESEKIFIYSDNALYRRYEGSVRFTGRPRASSMTEEARTEYRADNILFFIEDEKIELEGNAEVNIFLDEPEM